MTVTASEHREFIVHRLKALKLAWADPKTGELAVNLRGLSEGTALSPETLRHWILDGTNLDGHAAFLRLYEFLGVELVYRGAHAGTISK